MSFSLGYEDLPSSSYQLGPSAVPSMSSDFHYEGQNVTGIASTGEEAYTTSFSAQAAFGGGAPSLSSDLKSMLESNKEGLKLEAMKRLVSLIARGKSESVCRSLFPSVVKCVVSKNAEVKKLVYSYLVRFAENEPDLALLSVSSFQRSLKDPNPFIRGSALRALSSIRVPVIAPLIMSSIKESAHDMSPYVRKISALSIPKLIALDPEMLNDCISVLETLMKDRTCLVLSSVIATFNQVCPDRFDLIHQHYRKFVTLLPDFDEWGQVILIQLLTRYARTQFLDPVKAIGDWSPKEKVTKDATSDEDNEEEDDDDKPDLDLDLKMLLKNCRPLLQSRNSSVVFTVLQLHLAIFLPKDLTSSSMRPSQETMIIDWLSPIIKPLVRLIASTSSRQEITQLVLTSIVSLTSKSILARMFEPYLKSFFVKSRDTLQVKLLKLQVLTNLSTRSNIALILREFQAYVNTYSSDPGESDSSVFVSSVITGIGDVATRIREVAEICLKGLISLLSNRSNEAIVAQAVIVIRTQIMNKEREAELIRDGFVDSTESADNQANLTDTNQMTALIIRQLVTSKLMDGTDASLTMDKDRGRKRTAWSQARATIVWILSEFCVKNQTAYQLSPDVLRRLAKTFPNESDLVKLQVLTLATKMSLSSHPEVVIPAVPDMAEKAAMFDRTRLELLVTYIFNLAKYDLNYDIRDRARFLRALLNLANEDNDKLEKVKYVLFQRVKPPTGIEGSSAPASPNHETSGEESPKKRFRRKKYIEYSRYRVGTLAHFLNQLIPGYEELPDFPEEQPDPSVRCPPVEVPVSQASVVTTSSSSESRNLADANDMRIPSTSTGRQMMTLEEFYSDDEEDDDEDDDEEGSDEDEEESEDDDEESSEEEGDEGETDVKGKESDEADDDGSDGEEESSDEDVKDVPSTTAKSVGLLLNF